MRQRPSRNEDLPREPDQGGYRGAPLFHLQGAQERIKELVANEYTITQFDAVIIPLTDSKLIDATKKLVGLLKK